MQLIVPISLRINMDFIWIIWNTMQNRQRLVLLNLLALIIQVQWVATGPSPRMIRKRSSIQCPRVHNDEDALILNQLPIPLDPHRSYSKSRGFLDPHKHIYHLKIFHETSIPSIIFGFTQLKQLEIRNTCFFPCHETTIPSAIQCLASSLTELSIYHTKITHLPDTIGELNNLTTLKLSHTGLMFLPDSIGRLTSLTFLHLPNNNLTSLPMTIRYLRFLRVLTLTSNPYLHSIQPINNLPLLESLDTRHCSIEILPYNLSQLTTLYMTNNRLTKLTDIETLGNGTTNPKSFYFDRNQIESLSPTIDRVRNLHLLQLNNNHLRSLPVNILHIPTLRHLSVENNSLDRHELKDISSRFH